MRLQNRVALVTGAAMGIGKAIAQLFAQEGARVVAADVNQAAAQTEHEIREAGGECLFVRTDISREPEVEALIQAGTDRFGTIDVLLNVAGIAHEAPAHQLKLEDWHRILDVNLVGTFLCAKHVLPGMLQARRGAIVNISSIQGLFGSLTVQKGQRWTSSMRPTS